MGVSLTEKPSRGRPRSEEGRVAILQAFVDLSREQGYEKVSIDAVAKRAGVSRSTIYRWYKDKREIVVDASVDLVGNSGFSGATGNFSDDINSFFSATFVTANDIGQLFTAMMAEAQADSDFANTVWRRYSAPRREALRLVILQAPGAGEVGAEGMEFMLDMLFGAIWYRMMSKHSPLDLNFQQELIKTIKTLIARG